LKKIKKCKNNKILILVSLIIVFSLSFVIPNVNINNNAYSDDIDNKIERESQNNNLRSQSLTIDNNYTGVGAAWNLTHYANRTDPNLDVSFTNNSYDDTKGIPLYSDWEGYRLNAKINNLYDTKNWNNGTFNFGTDDGDPSAGDDDSSFTNNNTYQNWTFYEDDVVGHNNVMSGNYRSNLDGHDCIELRMDGVLSGSYYCYDNRDKCMWNSSFKIDRGKVIDSELHFDVNPYYLTDFNSWELAFSLNQKKIYTIGIYTLKQYGAATWRTFKIPQVVWTNTSNIYTYPINETSMNISVALVYNSATACYSTDFPNIAYQQLFIDNIKIIPKAEVKPSQIEFKMNQTTVTDIGWGKGTVEINSSILEGNWLGEKVYANFSSNHIWNFSSFNSSYFDVDNLITYKVDLKADLNLYAIKNSPETNYIKDPSALGLLFSVSNDSLVNWDCFGYVSVPVGYKETELGLQFPTDVNITRVSEPQNPNKNNLSLCDNSTQGSLIINVSKFSDPPDGFWEFEALSPNYCEQLTILNNATGSWIEDNEFLSGDYLNITAKITNNILISDYIQSTKAYLNIRFPNGTIWASKIQEKSPLADGSVYFDPIIIPASPPAYEVGIYDAIMSWNNSYSSYGLNETGVIYKKFTVIHNSTLSPDENKYYYEDIIEEKTVNLRVLFNDKMNNDAITNAHVYVYKFTGGMQNFSEISPGLYFLEFNVSGAPNAGNNTLTIFANSSLFVNNKMNITIEVIKATTFTADETIISVPWRDNFTIQFNFTEQKTGNGITATPTNNWNGESHTIMTAPGEYSITCNTSLYAVNQIHSLIISVDEYGYEQPPDILVKIEIAERNTNLDEIYLNQTLGTLIVFPYGDLLNITAKYSDQATGSFISGATVQLRDGETILDSFSENPTLEHYNLTINTTVLGVEVNLFTIYAKQDNYTTALESIITLIERETALTLKINETNISHNGVFELQVNETINLFVTYKDMFSGDHIDNATVEITGAGISANLTEYGILEQYNITLSADNLTKGFNFLTIIAQKENTKPQSISFSIELIERKTNIKLFINQTDITTSKTYVIQIGDIIDIIIYYLDDTTKEFLDSATVELTGLSVVTYLTEYSNSYKITISSVSLTQSINFLKIIAEKNNYQPQPMEFRIDIIERQTYTSLYLNQLNKTIDKSIELPINATLNITYGYFDNVTKEFIHDAFVQLVGTDILFNFTEVPESYQYELIIDTGDLDFGIKFLTLVAEKTNYQSSSDLLKIIVRQIKTNITAVYGDVVNIRVGGSHALTITLYDVDNEEYITNATVRYSGDLGQGVFIEDLNNPGTYIANFETLGLGNYIITITVTGVSGDYLFESKEVAITVTVSEEEALLFLGGLIAAISAAIGIGGYFIAYQRYLKYPKPVRKVHKFKRTLKRKSAPSVEITSRDVSFKSLHKEGLGKVSRFKPGKLEDKLPSLDIKSEAKFAEEPPSTETQPEIEPTEKPPITDEKSKKISDKSKENKSEKSAKSD